MENLLFLLATTFVLRLSSARSLKNARIGRTGCTALLPVGDNGFDKTKTESGDDLYFHDFQDGAATFGVICIRLQEEYTLEDASQMLGSYLDKLRGPFFILHHVGQQSEADWNAYNTRTIVDYWQDENGFDWKVKGYTDGRTLAVLYVQNIAEVEVKKQDGFLDSFHFGG